MYLEHFALRDFPFAITPDTSYFMNRAGYQDALNVLLVALRSGEGFVKITGEVGIGKTLLCRKLLNTLGADFVRAYIHNPYLEPASLLLAIADELSVTYEEGISQHFLIKRIAKALLDYYRDKKQVVLCLDEVQAMPVETLETLRLLTNLETERRKLLQVVLFGQPELDALLKQPSVRQLRQRITFSYRLLPLNRVALLAYVRHRLAIAGYRGKDLFTRGALHLLYKGSEGIPRLINIICHKAMMLAYGKGDLIVTRAHMRVAVEDTVEAQRIERSWVTTLFPTFTRWLHG
ncbi:MAG: AAA family ATPase [Gammaproteobacteria bacterium]|nr:AAA family ATPase [Gammaproteobacteria bacterium]